MLKKKNYFWIKISLLSISEKFCTLNQYKTRFTAKNSPYSHLISRIQKINEPERVELAYIALTGIAMANKNP